MDYLSCILSLFQFSLFDLLTRLNLKVLWFALLLNMCFLTRDLKGTLDHVSKKTFDDKTLGSYKGS